MSEYIKISDEKIVEHVCGKADASYIIVPDGFEGTIGMSIKEFDASWNLRLLSDRVKEGLVSIDSAYILDGETVRPKTLAEKISSGLVTIDNRHVFDGVGIREKTVNELYRDGLESVPKGWKVVEDSVSVDGLTLVSMSLLEQIEKSVISIEEATLIEASTVRSARNSKFTVYDAQVAKVSRARRLAVQENKDVSAIDAVLRDLDAYATALADIPAQAGFPFNVVWPVPVIVGSL